MAVVGVLTCEILELEFAHLLAKDHDVARVTVLDNKFAARFIDASESAGRHRPTKIPILQSFSPDSSDRLEVLVYVLEIALHNRKRHLQDARTPSCRRKG